MGFKMSGASGREFCMVQMASEFPLPACSGRTTERAEDSVTL